MLLVEDEPLISMSIEDVLFGLGCAKVFAATTVPAALGHLTAETIDVAVIDIVLRSETTFELARTLRDRGIPFVFTTGTRISGMPADFRDAPFP